MSHGEVLSKMRSKIGQRMCKMEVARRARKLAGCCVSGVVDWAPSVAVDVGAVTGTIVSWRVELSVGFGLLAG